VEHVYAKTWWLKRVRAFTRRGHLIEGGILVRDFSMLPTVLEFLWLVSSLLLNSLLVGRADIHSKSQVVV